jgi:hypothetical protein
MKPLKTKSNPVSKNVNVSWYGEITLKILKRKPIKSIRIKSYLDISIMCPLDTKNLINKKKSFEKDF